MRNMAKSGTTTTAHRRATVVPAAAGPERLDHVFAVVARHFAVLSDPTRLKILHAICQQERSVTAIVAATGAAQTNVSRHLALMHASGVVSRRRDGNAVYYRVADPELVEMCRTVCMQIASRIDEQKPLKQDLLQFAAQH